MAKAVYALISAICIGAVAAVAASDFEELYQPLITVVGHHSTSVKPRSGGNSVFNVIGQLYCDPCHLQYVTPLSTPIVGAGVRLECVDEVTKKPTYAVEDLTNQDGVYELHVEGDHEDEICNVRPINSTMASCATPMWDVTETRITCAKNSGMHDLVRFAAPLGFVTKEVDPKCHKIIQEAQADDQE